MGREFNGACAANMETAHEEAPHGLSTRQIRAYLLKKAHHSGERVFLEISEVRESAGGAIPIGIRRGGLGVEVRQCVLDDVGYGVHGAVAVPVAENGAEDDGIVVAEGDQAGDSILVNAIEGVDHDLLQLLLGAVAPPGFIESTRVRVRGRAEIEIEIRIGYRANDGRFWGGDRGGKRCGEDFGDGGVRLRGWNCGRTRNVSFSAHRPCAEGLLAGSETHLTRSIGGGE